MINTFFVVGEIEKINISIPKDSSEPESAVILLRYGAQRQPSNGAVEFTNSILVRIPSFKFAALKERLIVGWSVHLHGHLQGVVKNGYTVTEVVADRISIQGAEKPAH